MVSFLAWLVAGFLVTGDPGLGRAADTSIEATIAGLKPGAEAYITSGMKAFDSPGLAIAIVANDRIVYSKGFGVRSKAGGAPVDTRTVFQIGSATKGFLATQRWL